ncbi:MAG: DNA alkylation repair protein [Solobacterium sp.]|nr:DNA alkylation repair protein [Solobacterium sp.]
MIEEIQEQLFENQDKKYQAFQSNLTPTVKQNTTIGVRTPQLRKMAKEFIKREDANIFLQSLPHTYFEENQLHGMMLSEIKDFQKCIDSVSTFLPYVDNWATCDQMIPKVFKKHKQELLPYIQTWIKSDHTYTVRFAIKMLMEHFLDDDFDLRYPEMVSSVHTDEYYINMISAWYFATALAKQYDAILPFLTEGKLTPWVHNKTIQKTIESYRITDEQKVFLRSLRISKERK